MDTSSLKMRNIQDMFFKYNLQHWWDNNLYKFAGDMFMREAGTFSKFKFKDLDDYTQNMLIKYGIGDKEWNLIRTCKQTMPDGRDYISPEFLDKLRPEIEASLAKEVSGRLLQDTTDKTLGDLKDKFKLFYYDRIRNNVVPMPNARGRNLALWGSRAQKGTWSGEAIRSVMQFKGFTLSFMQNILGREVFGQGFTTAKDFATYGNVNRIGKLVAYMGIGGVMIQALRDLMAGKKPRDPRDPKTLMAGLAQSGGLGFGSDLLFGAYTRDGGTPLDAAMGPNFKLLDDILGLYGDIRNGDVSQAKANALRTLVSNTPFINMFYWRWAFNYGVIYPLQESMNPGFLARMQDRVKQQNDQTFWAPPSQFALKY